MSDQSGGGGDGKASPARSFSRAGSTAYCQPSASGAVERAAADTEVGLHAITYADLLYEWQAR